MSSRNQLQIRTDKPNGRYCESSLTDANEARINIEGIRDRSAVIAVRAVEAVIVRYRSKERLLQNGPNEIGNVIVPQQAVDQNRQEPNCRNIESSRMTRMSADAKLPALLRDIRGNLKFLPCVLVRVN